MKFKVVYPILGFEDEKEFELEEIDDMFYRLEGKNVRFSLINPFTIRDDYDFELDEEFAKNMKLKEGNVLVLNILTLEEPFINSTINFAGPIILNIEDKLLGQAVLDKYNYSLARPLKDFIKSEDEN